MGTLKTWATGIALAAASMNDASAQAACGSHWRFSIASEESVDTSDKLADLQKQARDDVLAKLKPKCPSHCPPVVKSTSENWRILEGDGNTVCKRYARDFIGMSHDGSLAVNSNPRTRGLTPANAAIEQKNICDRNQKAGDEYLAVKICPAGEAELDHWNGPPVCKVLTHPGLIGDPPDPNQTSYVAYTGSARTMCCPTNRRIRVKLTSDLLYSCTGQPPATQPAPSPSPSESPSPSPSPSPSTSSSPSP